MKKRNIGLLTAFAAAAALAPAAQAAPIVTPQDGHPGPYRLAFVTNGVSGAKSSAIDDYNAFVTAEAVAVTELADLNTTWKVIGSTGTVSAKVNTGTYIAADGGDYNAATDVPIYTTTGLRVALNNDELWNGSIENPIWYGDGSTLNEGNPWNEPHDPPGDQIWTGTNNDGTARAIGADGSYLGSSLGGDQTAANIELTRGGKTGWDWIQGVSSHDGEADSNRTYEKHFMALSGVINGGTTPAADPEITSIVKVGGTVTVEFMGTDGETYDLNKATALEGTFPDNPDSTANTITLTGTTTGTLTDSNATEDAAFYQVKQQP